jgi:uncharacterized repeat protein (TIGR01451 family)
MTDMEGPKDLLDLGPTVTLPPAEPSSVPMMATAATNPAASEPISAPAAGQESNPPGTPSVSSSHLLDATAALGDPRAPSPLPQSGQGMPDLNPGAPNHPALDEDAPRDEGVERTQNATDAPGSIPPENSRAARPTDPSSPTATAEASDTLAPERFPLGRQSVGVTVDVQAPSVININHEARFKIVVRNTGQTDALGVVVRDQLPEGMTYLASDPPADSSGSILTWKLGTLAAGSDRVLTLRTRPSRVGSFEHAATVSVLAGVRSRTLVQEPKLKVEQTAKPSRVPKGRPVEFQVAISNPGTGPVRNVVVQALLTAGLRHEQGSQIVFDNPLTIKPGERLELDPIVADTVEGGEQSCTVTARSPDVSESEDARAVATTFVTEPKLVMKLSGPTKRYTDTVAVYRLAVENPGTATAREVRVVANLPADGLLVPQPIDTQYDRQYDRYKRRLLWTIPQLEPRAHVELSFAVRLGGIQPYKVTADAWAEGGLACKDTCNTDVVGMADVDFTVEERQRILDVGEKTNYLIRIKNKGSKDASRLLIRAKLSGNIKWVKTSGTEQSASGRSDGSEVVFPAIDRLAPNAEIMLVIQVQAIKPGTAACEVHLVHDDLRDVPIIKTATTHIEATEPQPTGHD